MTQPEIDQMEREIHGEPEPSDHAPLGNPMDPDGPLTGPQR